MSPESGDRNPQLKPVTQAKKNIENYLKTVHPDSVHFTAFDAYVILQEIQYIYMGQDIPIIRQAERTINAIANANPAYRRAYTTASTFGTELLSARLQSVKNPQTHPKETLLLVASTITTMDLVDLKKKFDTE